MIVKLTIYMFISTISFKK